MIARLLNCSRCPKRFSFGTTRVYRRIVFHFCASCWGSKRHECDSIMQRT